MTYDYAHLICFSPTHSSHMIGETVLQGLGTGHVSETDLTYEKPEENLTIHSGITVIVVPVYGGRIAETALERMEGIYGQDSPAVAVVVYGNRDYDDALLELRDWCVAHGFVPVAGAAFIGVIVKTCSDSLFSIGQKNCQLFVAKLRNFLDSHNRMVLY